MTAIKKQDFVQDGSSIDGIDQLFETDTLTDGDPEIVLDYLPTNPTTNRDQADLTPEQAALALGKSVRTIRRMLEKGSLPGYKIAGKKRDEWRVAVTQLSDITDTIEDVKTDSVRDDDRLVIELKDRIVHLEEQLNKANREIQSAAYRNGYLEAQAELKDQQIKLLTDSQLQQQSWWARFSSWFFRSR